MSLQQGPVAAADLDSYPEQSESVSEVSLSLVLESEAIGGAPCPLRVGP